MDGSVEAIARNLSLRRSLARLVDRPSSAARCCSKADRLEPDLFAEALRWGDYRNRIHPYKEGPDETYTVEGYWKPEVDRIVHRYFPARVEAFRAQLQEAGLYEP